MSQKMRERSWTRKQENEYFGLLLSEKRLYDLQTSRVVQSRDVVFNESSRKTETKQEEKQVIQVETFNEEGYNSEHEESTDQDCSCKTGESKSAEIPEEDDPMALKSV